MKYKYYIRGVKGRSIDLINTLASKCSVTLNRFQYVKFSYESDRFYYVDDSGTLKNGSVDGDFFSLVKDTCEELTLPPIREFHVYFDTLPEVSSDVYHMFSFTKNLIRNFVPIIKTTQMNLMADAADYGYRIIIYKGGEVWGTYEPGNFDHKFVSERLLATYE